MALVKRCNKKTNFVLPITVKKNNFSTYWYYDNEYKLFSAYRQLLAINIGIIPHYPIIL